MKTLSDEAREARNKYYREWRKNHPERVREYAKKYWEKQIDAEKQAEKGEASDKQD